MSFTISKNKMSFVSDSNDKNIEYSNAADVYIAHDSQQLIGEIDVSSGSMNHFFAMVHVHFQGVSEANIPDCRINADWEGAGETTDLQLHPHMEPNSGQARGSGAFSFKDTLTKIHLIILPNTNARNNGQSFTIPANSKIHLSISPQDAVLSQLTFTGAAAPSAPPNVVTANTNSAEHTGTWVYRGNIERTGHNFHESPSGQEKGLFQLQQPTLTWIIYYHNGSSKWELGLYTDKLPDDHDFLAQSGHTGASMGIGAYATQDVDGIGYPDNTNMGGTLTIV